MDEQEIRDVLLAAVSEAREHWLLQQVWFLTPWGQWRRGSVQYIGDTGAMLVLVYKHGTPGIKVWSHIERIPNVLKLVNR
ncbi:MAG: hypothetical protein ACJ8DI_10490 [Ktedonobacteraceae bacterium]